MDLKKSLKSDIEAFLATRSSRFQPWPMDLKKRVLDFQKSQTSSLREVAKELGLSSSVFYGWRVRDRKDRLQGMGSKIPASQIDILRVARSPGFEFCLRWGRLKIEVC